MILERFNVLRLQQEVKEKPTQDFKNVLEIKWVIKILQFLFFLYNYTSLLVSVCN